MGVKLILMVDRDKIWKKKKDLKENIPPILPTKDVL